MEERKLASIRAIKEIRPIEGADRIVCAVVDGWEVVTQKSNGFKPGDLVVYFEIDSLLPIREQFSFLEQYRVKESNSVNGEGYRLKTIKLRGQISQGLILPLSELAVPSTDYPGCWNFTQASDPMNYEDRTEILLDVVTVRPEAGDDLTEILGVKKYEKPIPAQLAGKVRGNFPSFLRKTDQERIQNCFDSWFHTWNLLELEATLKLDGSSFTAYYVQEGPNQPVARFGVCSRNLDLAETEDNAFWQVARKYDLENKMAALGRSFAIQAELMGPGVQGNRERLPELDIYVFDVFNIATHTYVSAEERYKITEQLGLKHVPVIDTAVFSGFTSVKEFLRYAERPSINNDVAEGVVFKWTKDPYISFKAISNKYLMKED